MTAPYDSLIFCRALQAAVGLKYLSDKNIVHRDVSLRNLLASSGDNQMKFTVKVFGVVFNVTMGSDQHIRLLI
jgi:serine/threonine protein kinase